ncbi:MAG TPA: nucleotidyltransferase family protein [Bacteroidales bacterium]|nr:nucleotidyltransferase family protein [Bacteroidales bacterium]
MHQLLFHILNEKDPDTFTFPDKEKVDEERLLRFLKYNRLVPLFYDRVKPYAEHFSSEFTGQLKEIAKAETLRLMKKEAVFRKVIPLLEQHQVAVIAIKGFSISTVVYANPYLRPMADIDLLVPPASFQKAGQVLTEAGATLKKASGPESSGDIGYDCTYVYAGEKIELHHHLMNPSFRNSVSRETIFENITVGDIFGMQCRVLNPEMQLFYMLHHLSRHMDYKLARMIWLIDIHYFLKAFSGKLDWQKIRSFVSECGGDMDIYKGLYLCRELFNDDFPEGIPPCKNTGQLAKRYLDLCDGINMPSSNVGSLKMAGQIKGLGGKIRFIRQKLFPSADFVRHYYKVTAGKNIPRFYVRYYWEKGKKVGIFLMSRLKAKS